MVCFDASSKPCQPSSSFCKPAQAGEGRDLVYEALERSRAAMFAKVETVWDEKTEFQIDYKTEQGKKLIKPNFFTKIKRPNFTFITRPNLFKKIIAPNL